MRIFKVLFLLIAALLSFTILGCATTKIAQIVTDPANAKIYINDKFVGESPLQYGFYDFEGGVTDDYLVRAEKDGYDTALLQLKDGFGVATHIPAVIRLSLGKKQNPSSKGGQIEPSTSNVASYPSDIHTGTGIGTKWALVIGISTYKDTHIPPLRYASTDAKSFYDWLISSDGGGFAPANVELLTDRNATHANIKHSLFEWLGQALEEDVVNIFFAGHGSPQSPDYPSNLFLLPHDVKYDSIASTGFPMWDIETALKRFIRAKKVVVIADACHAGGVGQSFDIARRANRNVGVNRISSGLQNLSQIGDGVAVISASDEKQFSQESQKWGGGHGVFTYFLPRGLNGEADYNKDNRVTLGELIPYLSEQVRRETRNAQSPTVAGKFDPALTIGR